MQYTFKNKVLLDKKILKENLTYDYQLIVNVKQLKQNEKHLGLSNFCTSKQMLFIALSFLVGNELSSEWTREPIQYGGDLSGGKVRT